MHLHHCFVRNLLNFRFQCVNVAMKPLNKHHSQIPYDIVSFGFQTILIVLAGLQIVVYQFYSYVFKINQRRDKEVSVYLTNKNCTSNIFTDSPVSNY